MILCTCRMWRSSEMKCSKSLQKVCLFYSQNNKIEWLPFFFFFFFSRGAQRRVFFPWAFQGLVNMDMMALYEVGVAYLGRVVSWLCLWPCMRLVQLKTHWDGCLQYDGICLRNFNSLSRHFNVPIRGPNVPARSFKKALCKLFQTHISLMRAELERLELVLNCVYTVLASHQISLRAEFERLELVFGCIYTVLASYQISLMRAELKRLELVFGCVSTTLISSFWFSEITFGMVYAFTVFTLHNYWNGTNHFCRFTLC